MSTKQLDLAPSQEVGTVAPSIEAMMELAIRQGPEGVEALERLVGLKERMEDRQARMAFVEALGAFQREVEEVPKTRSAQIVTKGGGKYGYTYAPLEEITRTIREPLEKHGLSYSWDTEPSDRAGELLVVCVLRHVAGHESRSRFPVPTDTSAAMSAAQKNGAALTYGRRQSLVAVLGLTSADPDTDAAIDYVTDEQAANLSALMDEVAKHPKFPKFLEYFEIEAAADLPKARYAEAVRALEKMR